MDSELECWLVCYGTHLTLGIMVEVLPDSKFYNDFKGKTYMVTSLNYTDDGINIGINDGGAENTDCEYDGFGIDELKAA